MRADQDGKKLTDHVQRAVAAGRQIGIARKEAGRLRRAWPTDA
jgi:hypothetical protein